MNIKKKINMVVYLMFILVTIFYIALGLRLITDESLIELFIVMPVLIFLVLLIIIGALGLSYDQKYKKKTLTDEELNTLWWNHTWLYRIILGPIVHIALFGLVILGISLNPQEKESRDWFFLIILSVSIIVIVFITIKDAKKYLRKTNT